MVLNFYEYNKDSVFICILNEKGLIF